MRQKQFLLAFLAMLLCFAAPSFAQVAEVGGTEYTTLAEAISKASAGQTIKLIADVNESVTISKSLTIDGAKIDGAKFKYTGTMTGNKGITVTVQNLNFVNAGFDKPKAQKSTTGSYTFKNCTFEGQDKYAYPLRFYGFNSVSVEDCTVTNYLYSFLYVPSAGSNVSIKDVTVENCPNYAVYFASGVNTATFENFDVTNSNKGFIINNTASRSFAMTNCTFIKVNTAIDYNGGTSTITCKLSGANDFDIEAIGKYANIVLLEEGATLTAPEGIDVTTVEDYVVKYENGTYTSVKAVAKIGNVGYETLADAVAVAQAGETVKLIADATGAGVVINKSITIDFNGNTYTANEGVGSAGTQTLGLQILKDNNVTLKNGTLKSVGDNVKMLVQNYANLTVENMNLVDATDAIQYVLSNNSGDVVVKGTSKITAEGDRAIAFDACKYANYALPKVTIEKDVVVTGDVEVSATLNFAGTLIGNIIINGAEGVVNSTVEGLNVTTTIEGRNVVYTNGVYTTAEFEPVAKVNGKNYASLREAVDAAPAGATVYLLKDVTLEGGYEDATEGLRIEKAITIKGQDHTINCGKFSKGIRVYNQSGAKSIVSFYNLTIVNNNAAGRCIDTRSGNIDLLLYLSNLKATGTNSQPLTLGGQDRLYRVRVQGSSIDAGKSGYGIISFVPSWAGITCSTGTKINGFAAVYLKEGANGITLSLDKGTYTATNKFAKDSGVFGAVVVEGDNNTITVTSAAVVKAVSADGANMAQQAAFLIKEGATGNKITIGSGKVETQGDRACAVMVDSDVVASTTITGKQLVAECGGYQFISVDDAIRCADTGSTVKLLADVVRTTAQYVEDCDGYASIFNIKGRELTFDLNGHYIKVEANAADLANAKNKMLLAVFSTDDGGKLTLIDEAKTGKVEVVANDAMVYSLITNYEDGCYVTIEGGEYKADKVYDSLIYSGASDCVTINNGNYHLGNVGEGGAAQNGKPWIFNALGQNQRNIDVNGGTFNADINHQFWCFEVDVPMNRALRNNNDDTWTVVDAEAYVVEPKGDYTHEVGYETLEEAIAHKHKDNNTVVMVKDVDMEDVITIANGDELVLDLNGMTIAGIDNATGSFGLFTNKGNLTINDAVEGEGKITLKANNNRGWNAFSSVISNTVGGKLTVNGGTIEHLGGTDMAYGIDNLTNGKGTYAETIVEGGTIKSPYRAIRQFLNGVEAQNILTVNGGTIEGANKSIWMQDPSKNANTGRLTVGENATLKGNVYLFVTAGSTVWPVDVKIAKAALEGESSVVPGNVPQGYAVSEYPTYWTVEALNLAELRIEDNCESYVNVAEKSVGTLTYVRNFENDQWQTIYLPFAVPAANLMNEFEVAYIYNASYQNSVAAIDYVEIEDTKYVLQANYPYLIRAKEAGVKNIVVENAKLMKTAVKSIDCSSVFETFKFTGNYATIEDEPCDDECNNGHFVMNEVGGWKRFDSLNPFRVYMTIELRNGQAFPTEESIIMRKVDKNGNVDTSVEKIGVDADILGIYDLQGRRVLEPQKGEIYIINGKKVVF